MVMYLDTSALVKLVHPEPETDALRRYLAGRKRTPKCTSAVTITELIRAVRRANHDPAGGVRDRKTLDAETELARKLLAALQVVEVTRAVLVDAASADGPFLKSLDAIHLVAATRLAIGLTSFVTYDKRLAAVAEEAGLPVAVPA
jgi:predicted nucleic acid-binding protein